MRVLFDETDGDGRERASRSLHPPTKAPHHNCVAFLSAWFKNELRVFCPLSREWFLFGLICFRRLSTFKRLCKTALFLWAVRPSVRVPLPAQKSI